MNVKKIAITAGAVVAGSMAVGPILGAIGVKQEDGFGMDDVLAAVIVAGVVILVQSQF